MQARQRALSDDLSRMPSTDPLLACLNVPPHGCRMRSSKSLEVG
jgi:hypothetical protein